MLHFCCTPKIVRKAVGNPNLTLHRVALRATFSVDDAPVFPFPFAALQMYRPFGQILCGRYFAVGSEVGKYGFGFYEILKNRVVCRSSDSGIDSDGAGIGVTSKNASNACCVTR